MCPSFLQAGCDVGNREEKEVFGFIDNSAVHDFLDSDGLHSDSSDMVGRGA